MSSGGVKIDGLEEVINRIKTMQDITNVQKAIEKSCLLVERSAKQLAPKGDGELRRSITHEIEGLTGRVFTPLYYAPYVEYGTGIYAEGGKGRQEVPWVYVEGSGSADRATKKVIYTPQEAEATVAYLRSKGLPAFATSGEKPSPYLRPALQINRENIMKLLKESIADD